MEPYYSEAGISLYFGDCREVIPSLWIAPPPIVALTDPPYNLGIAYGPSTDDCRNDYREWCRSWFVVLRAVAYVVALSPGIGNVARWCSIAAPDWIGAWHKPAAMGRSPIGFNNWEPVLIYGRTRTRGAVDVVTAPIVPDSTLNGHPCPKPLAWATGWIDRLAAPDDLIVDPFCGSGTTLEAAYRLGHGAIGIEIEERYCEAAAKRIRRAAMEPRLPLDTIEPRMLNFDKEVGNP